MKRKERKDRLRALIEVKRWCHEQAEKYTIGPESPAYHIYRDVERYIDKLIAKAQSEDTP